jgi:hypothetical protein
METTCPRLTDTTEVDQIAALIAVIRAAYDQNPSASPSWLATAAMQSIGFPRDLHPVGYVGAHHSAQQIAQAIAAGKDQDHIIQTLMEGLDPTQYQTWCPACGGLNKVSRGGRTHCADCGF